MRILEHAVSLMYIESYKLLRTSSLSDIPSTFTSQSKIMPTIKSKQLIDDLILNNGHFADDPQVHSIIEYKDTNGSTCYGLNYGPDDNYYETEYVREPKVIFKKD